MLGKNTFAKNLIIHQQGIRGALLMFFGSAGIMFFLLAPLPASADYTTATSAVLGDYSVSGGTLIFGNTFPVCGDNQSVANVSWRLYAAPAPSGSLTTAQVLTTINAGNGILGIDNTDYSSQTWSYIFSNVFAFASCPDVTIADVVSGPFAGIIPTGDYFWENLATNGVATYYAAHFDTSNGWSFTIPDPDHTSRIISFSPTIGSSTATTTNLSATIYNNSASSSYQSVHFHLVNSNCDVTVQTCLYSPVDISLPINFDGMGTLSTTTQFANGLYVGYVTMEPPDSITGLRPSSVMSFTAGINPSAALITFNTAQGTSTATTTDLSQGCSTTVLGVPVGAFACFLFVPDVTTVAQIANLPQQLSGKLPFVYAFQINTIRQNVFNASGTASTSLTVSLWKLGNEATSTLTLISASQIAAVPFAGMVKSILTFLIWLGMAEYIYYRVLRIHDTNTPK